MEKKSRHRFSGNRSRVLLPMVLGFFALALLIAAPLVYAQTGSLLPLKSNASASQVATTGSSTPTTGQTNAAGDPGLSFQDLVVLDKLFAQSSSLMSGQDKINLGDLLILNKIFNPAHPFPLNNQNGNLSLGDLMVLDKLFANGTSLAPSQNGRANLGDLFILNQMFNDGQNFLVPTSPTNSATK